MLDGAERRAVQLGPGVSGFDRGACIRDSSRARLFQGKRPTGVATAQFANIDLGVYKGARGAQAIRTQLSL